MRNLHETPPPASVPFERIDERFYETAEIVAPCRNLARARPFLDQSDDCLQAMVEVLANEEQKLLHGDLYHYNILYDDSAGWIAIDPKGQTGASCLDVGAFVGNAGNDDLSREEECEVILGAVKGLSESSGESEERVLGGAFFDWLVWSARALATEPDDREAHRRTMLSIYVELLEVSISRGSKG